MRAFWMLNLVVLYLRKLLTSDESAEMKMGTIIIGMCYIIVFDAIYKRDNPSFFGIFESTDSTSSFKDKLHFFFSQALLAIKALLLSLICMIPVFAVNIVPFIFISEHELAFFISTFSTIVAIRILALIFDFKLMKLFLNVARFSLVIMVAIDKYGGTVYFGLESADTAVLASLIFDTILSSAGLEKCLETIRDRERKKSKDVQSVEISSSGT